VLSQEEAATISASASHVNETVLLISLGGGGVLLSFFWVCFCFFNFCFVSFCFIYSKRFFLFDLANQREAVLYVGIRVLYKGP